MAGKTRLAFLKQVAATAVAPYILSAEVRAGQAQKLRHAAIGTAPRPTGFGRFRDQSRLRNGRPVRRGRTLPAGSRQTISPSPRCTAIGATARDEADQIDSVNVTVPNHMHAPIAMTAMRMGKHVYCQKPLTHSISSRAGSPKKPPNGPNWSRRWACKPIPTPATRPPWR